VTLLRPKFNEGQILSAGDLGKTVDYARYADAAHGRTQHTWGVVTGLELSKVDQATPEGDKFIDVHLTPGIAIDPSGRRIVVEAEQLLSTVQFNNLGVAGANEPDALYPVYVIGVDRPQAAQSPGACASNSPTRVAEAFQIDFGRPGSETAVLAPPAVAFDASPGIGMRVLVGYVAWNPNLAGGKFIAISPASPTGAVRYAGVRAAEVVAPKGSVVLHTQDTGKRFALSLAEDGQGGCKLLFGSRQGAGAIKETFSVNEKGDVTFSGAWKVQLPTAPVAESGAIFHGLRVPLPAGVSEAAVAAGQFTAHVVVAPLALGVSTTEYPIQVECRVDADRRVSSIVMWRTLTGDDYRLSPAACQYLVVAAPTS